MNKAFAIVVIAAGVLATVIASAAVAAVPAVHGVRVSPVVIQRMATSDTQDILVVYDESRNAVTSAARADGEQSAATLSAAIEQRAAQFKSTKTALLSRFDESEVTVLMEYSHLPISFLRLHSAAALAKLTAQPEVIGVYEDAEMHANLAESLPLIKQPQAAAQGYIGTGTTVAVLDTGADYTRAAFGSCSAPGGSCKVAVAADFVTSDGHLDTNGHGTNVAAIVLGVAPGARVAALRVLSASGSGATSGIVSAINYAVANKATYNIVAMNLSLGGGPKYTAATTDAPYYAAFSSARAAGILPVAASGNDAYTNGMTAPGAVVGAVSVGAVYDSSMGGFSWKVGCTDSSTRADLVTCFSNSANFLTMLAPGSQITAAGITESGTSQATPHVAGATAVLRAAYPNETLDQTVARLTNGDPVTDPRNDITKPRLNLLKALALTSQCTYSIASTTASVAAGASTGTDAVTATSGCAWLAASGSSWITVTGGASGTGNGTVSYSVAANTNSSARTGTISIAGKTLTITQAGASGTAATNILLNPGFEDGANHWTQSTANGLPVITTFFTPSANNTGYAWFCGYDNCVDTIYQDVTIPSDAGAADLQFQYSIDTAETGATALDTFTARIYSPPTAGTYTTCNTLSNLNATTTWTLSSKCNLLAFRGQTIRVQLVGLSNSQNSSSFYVDNITLTVSGSALADTQAPSVPQNLTATAISSSQVNLSWTASTDNVAVTSYKVYSSGVLLGSVTAAGGTVTGLSPATTYTYTVSACDAAGNCSGVSNSATVRTPNTLDSQPPTVPTGVTATATGSTTVNVQWQASTDDTGVTSYRVYRGAALVATTGNVLSYQDSGLNPSSTYTYRVAACDAAANCSAQSNAANATTSAVFTSATPVVFSGSSSFQTSGSLVNILITKIVNNSTTITSGSLRLELWALDKPYSFGGGSTGYRTASIRTNQISGGSDQLLPNGSFNNLNLNLSYTPPGLPSDNNFALLLLEYNPTSCNTSDNFCTIDYLNYHEISPPTVPQSLSASPTSSSTINLSWLASTDNVGVVAYKVYRGGVVVANLGNVTGHTDTGLAANTGYSYTVSACDAAGNCSAQSDPASATTPAQGAASTPTIPTGLRATVVSATQINLAWTAATDAVGVTAYNVYSSGVLVDTLGSVTSSTRRNIPGTTYTYTVSACNAAGNCSAQSAPAIATTPSGSSLAALSKRGGIDLDGNNKGAIVLRSSAASPQILAGRLVSGQFQFTSMPDPGPSFRLLGVGDFDGNGVSDLAFLNSAQITFGDVKFWRNFSQNSEVLLRQVKQVWDVQAVGDLDGDGYADLVWRYLADDPRDTGVSYIWFMNGSTVTQVRKRGGAPLNWKLLGAVDLNGDGAADMIYISPDGQVKALMATANRTCANFSVAPLPSGYNALRLADFTGNGRGDILVRNPSTGQVSVMSINATAITLPPPSANPDDPNANCTATTTSIPLVTYNLPVADPTWQFYASGDFDGDGITDIVWKQPNGTLTVWLLVANGGTPTVISNAGTAPAGFTVLQP